MQRPQPLTIIIVLLSFLVLVVNGGPRSGSASLTADYETRCGWFSNPTPANISLYDREAEWVIGVQGGYQVPNDWDWPRFKKGQWIKQNVGDYGYGCVCMQVRVDRRGHQVDEIKSVRARPLTACRADASLKRWKQLFR